MAADPVSATIEAISHIVDIIVEKFPGVASNCKLFIVLAILLVLLGLVCCKLITNQYVGYIFILFGFVLLIIAVLIVIIGEKPEVADLSASIDLNYPQAAGENIIWTAVPNRFNGTVYYEFSLIGPATNMRPTIKREWAPNDQYRWETSGLDVGENRIKVSAGIKKHIPLINIDSYLSKSEKEKNCIISNYMETATIKLRPNLSDPQPYGKTVRWRAEVPYTDDILEYRFFLWYNNNSLLNQPSWNINNTWDWHLNEVGNYIIQAQARKLNYHKNPEKSDYNGSYYYTVRENSLPSIQDLRPSPQGNRKLSRNETIIWTARANDPDDDPILYKFSLKSGSTKREWQDEKKWHNDNTYNWSPSRIKDSNMICQVRVFVSDSYHKGESRNMTEDYVTK